MQEKQICRSGEAFTCQAITLRDLIFNPLPHRSETATVILGHKESEVIPISIRQLRVLILQLMPAIGAKNLQAGDTVLLASFYASNELANALLFAAFGSMGIRVFIPIYPEAAEFDTWQVLTGFKAVIMPYREIQRQRGLEHEKEAIARFEQLCNQHKIPFLDAWEDFNMETLLKHIQQEPLEEPPPPFFETELTTENEAVIFTTSGTSGKSKLVVYNQGAFSLSCQVWQQTGLFAPEYCGNPSFTPLFTHTIGIRTFINALWTGQPVCILVVDWFLHKPEAARYLLLRMNPGHIVGGPAMFNMLLEFFRQFPELKISLRRHLRTLVSIGAPYSKATAEKVKSALGIDLWNAFGTTETQMVLLNRPEKGQVWDNSHLGKPLPGVRVKLLPTATDGLYEMCLQSPYQSARIIGEPAGDGWFYTGDLVSIDPATQNMLYASRKGKDFIKDDFGVKVPVTALQEYYGRLYQMATHIEWVLLENKPGLAALLFLKPAFKETNQKELAEWLKARNEQLQERLQPFEFAHRHLERFSLKTGEPPLTRKGTVSLHLLHTQYEAEIEHLRNPWYYDAAIESVEAETRSLMYKFSNPHMATLLEALKMDVVFDRGEKDFLFYQQKGKTCKVLDLVGGFGSGLLGHNHSGVKNAISQFLASERPAINTQGSLYYYPSLLSRQLNTLFSEATGRFFKVMPANSGAEAMEMALHHAYFEWRSWVEKQRDEQYHLYGAQPGIDVGAIWEENRQRVAAVPAAIIVINNCFHGYSSGARSLLNAKKQRNHFTGLLHLKPLHISDVANNWREQAEKFLKENVILLQKVVKEGDEYVVREFSLSTVIASVIEPVRGEGGIYETNRELSDFLSQQKFPLIADEIQCGLGRTGELPAYPHATYYLLGKSLGGGYEKIAAVLIADDHFKPEFGQYYTSTFANGELAACTALASLKCIRDENVVATAAAKGKLFEEKLLRVAAAYPMLIAGITGRGLMLGIHFKINPEAENIILRVLQEHELLGYLFSGWFFHNKNIRVLPSLSKPDSLRIEPSVYITEESMDEFCEALMQLCCLVNQGNMYELLKYLMEDDPYLDRVEKVFRGTFPKALEEPAPGALKVGFIGNFTIPPLELSLIENDLKQSSDTGIRLLFNKMQTLLEGKSIRLFSKNLMNGRIHFTFYILPFDTAHLEMVSRWGKKRFYISRIQDTIDKLVQEGVSHISLGAHVSIISGNGLYLSEPNKVKILTGNTLTVASALYHASGYFSDFNETFGHPATIAVVGANGNIGSGLAACFDEQKYAGARIILAGNNPKKLELLRKKVFGKDRCVECTTDLFRLQDADIIISCTNTNDPIIFAHHIAAGRKVFIIDLAVPGSVADEVKRMPLVQFCRDASTVFMHHETDFLISTHTPKGKVFCCAGEVMLAALHNVQLPLRGHVNPASIKAMMKLGIEEGIFKTNAYATLV